MNVNRENISKADVFLKQALAKGNENQTLRVVMSLQEKKGQNWTLPELNPDQFSTYTEYRQALIERIQQKLKEGIVGETIKQLQDLSLTTYGGKTSSVIVVEGTANQIYQALQLSGVKSASLDQVISLIDDITGDYNRLLFH